MHFPFLYAITLLLVDNKASFSHKRRRKRIADKNPENSKKPFISGSKLLKPNRTVRIFGSPYPKQLGRAVRHTDSLPMNVKTLNGPRRAPPAEKATLKKIHQARRP